MPKQKTVPTVNPMKTYSIKVSPKLMAKAVKLKINTAKTMREALASAVADSEGECMFCGSRKKQAKKAKS